MRLLLRNLKILRKRDGEEGIGLCLVDCYVMWGRAVPTLIRPGFIPAWTGV